MAKDTQANWQNVEVESLSAEQKAAYEAFKAKSREAAELRAKFENMVNEQAGLPAGRKLVFGYRFGKLSVAVVADEGKAKAAQPAKLSLADYLKGQAAAGKPV